MWRIFNSGGQRRPAPVVDKVEPPRGPMAGGIHVRVTGSGFNGASAVSFGDAAATFQVNSDSEIVVPSLPRGAHGGTVDVTVTAAGQTTRAGNRRFEYLPMPVITTVACVDTQPRWVRIVGRHLVDVVAVQFGTEPAECYEQDPDGSIRARRHRGKAGPTPVTVVTPGGTSDPATVTFPADGIRTLVVVVSVLYLCCLFAGLFVYIDWPTFKAHVPAMLGPIPLLVPWLGAVGAVLLSLSGLVDHFGDWDSSYLVWHLVRPLIGAVAGSIAALILIGGIITVTGPSNLPTGGNKDILYDTVAFLVGYREETFRTLIKRISDVIIGPGDSKPAAPAASSPAPTPAPATEEA
jgi:hypothetical protein